jgi:hypothetical protein
VSPSRLLIAAGTSAGDLGNVPSGVRLLVESADEIMVVSPALPTRLKWLASDTDETIRDAEERLAAILADLDEQAVTSAEVGADDPMVAFGDAAREFSPDHILVAMRSGDRADWQERGLIDQLLSTFSVPLTVFLVHPRPER